MIDQSMAQFLAERSGTKYIFFGGKGGVGKTVLAGAAALWLAQQGKRTLLGTEIVPAALQVRESTGPAPD